MNDPLSYVPLRQANTGAATIAPSGEFSAFTGGLLQMRMKEIEEAKLRNAAALKLLNDNVKSNWTQDNINHFAPKMKEIRDYTIKLFGDRQGKLNDMDLFDLQSKWNELKSQAEVSNAMYKEEVEAKKSLIDNPEKYDYDESMIRRSVWNNPMAYAQTKKEVEDAGGIFNWRVQNQGKYDNQRGYDAKEDVKKQWTDKLSTWQERDKNGLVKWTDRGDFQEGKGFKGIDPTKVDTHYDQFWARNDWNGKKFRAEAFKMASQHVALDDQGHTIALTPTGQQMIIAAGDVSKKTAEEKAEIFGKLAGKEYVKAQFPTEQIVLTQAKKANNNFSFGGAGGMGVGGITTAPTNMLRVPGSTGSAGATFTGQQFNVNPYKTVMGLNGSMIDLATNEPIKEVGSRNIQVGEFKVAPVATRDLVITETGGKTYKIKKGQVINDDAMQALRATYKDNVGEYANHKVFGVGQADLKGDAMLDFSNLNLNDLGKTWTHYLIPGDQLYGAIENAVSKEEKAILRKNFEALQEEADRRNFKVNKAGNQR